MRALAVGLVVIYHLAPGRLSGGFVGVDVFFVISGFLITTNLLTSPPKKPRDVIAFWGRRVRRLLPAAFTVIVVTLIAVVAFGPVTEWAVGARMSQAAALYVENWALYANSVNYIASTAPATPFQHYWSLSVEEQFYLVWPLMMAAAVLIARLRPFRDHFRRVAAVGVALVLVASAVYSVWYTGNNPAAAYYVTPTRMWELAAGGAVACLYPRLKTRLDAFPALKVLLVTVGVAMIIWAGFSLDGSSFPGWVAWIPVGGAMIVIAAGPADYRISYDRFLKWRPFQALGDMSYSIYLWHFPLIVVLPWALEHTLTMPAKIVLLFVIVAISWLSKTFIEDRFRGSRPLGIPLRRTFIFLIVGMLVTTGLAQLVITGVQVIGKPNQRPVIPASAVCVGAAAFLDPTCTGQDPHGTRLLTSPLQAANDRTSANADGCVWDWNSPTNVPICEFGSTDPDATQIALWGNSHTSMYLEPVVDIAKADNLTVRTYFASACYPSLVPLAFAPGPQQDGCTKFTTQALADMKAHNVKVVVMSQRTDLYALAGIPASDQGSAVEQMTENLINLLTSEGIRVIVIRDVPYFPDNIVDCIASNLRNLSACDQSAANSMQYDPVFDAASRLKGDNVSTLDFTDAVCDTVTCYAVVGGVIVYCDSGHFTTTFAMTLEPYISKAVLAAVSQ